MATSEEYTTIEDDLQSLDIQRLQKELDAAKKENQELVQSGKSNHKKLWQYRYGNVGKVAKRLAIVVPIVAAVLVSGWFGYNNFGGGPEGRAITAQAERVADAEKKAAERSRSWEANCEKAGGRVVGEDQTQSNTTQRFCVFENGASLNKGGDNS